MFRRFIETLGRNSGLRITLAVALVLIGFAPIGAPILTDTNWRNVGTASAEAQDPASAPAAYQYRWSVAGGMTSVERTEDSGKVWQPVASVPEPVVELIATPGAESIVYARSESRLWISRDGGRNWEQAQGLPSKPAALAVASRQANAVYVGTESVGLVVSRDQGASWQVIDDPVLSLDGSAPVAVTALALNKDDESIAYAATGVWTGASQARLTAMGVFVSVDGGRSWQAMEQTSPSFNQTTRLSPVDGRPLAVTAVSAQGERTVEMRYSPELADQLKSPDPSVRASAAKLLGLIGDRQGLPTLLPALQDKDLLAGDRAAEAIGRLGDQSAAVDLMPLLRSDNEAVRARAALALGLLKVDAAVGPLGEMLRTDTAMPARRAAEALARIGSPAAIAALTAPLSDEELTPARQAAMTGLEQAGDNAVRPLIAALDAGDSATRTHAATMLGFLKAEDAANALAKKLTDADPAVRAQAAWALSEIHTPAALTALQSARQAGADAQKLSAIQTAEQRGAATAAGEEQPALGAQLLSRLGEIPATRWSFFALFLLLAAALLLFTPRPHAGQHIRR